MIMVEEVVVEEHLYNKENNKLNKDYNNKCLHLMNK